MKEQIKEHTETQLRLLRDMSKRNLQKEAILIGINDEKTFKVQVT